MLLENHLELLALYGGCAYAGFSLFGVNTGLRGATLDRRFISQDLPVAIPEEGADLIVENTQPRMRKSTPPLDSDVVELDDVDFVDDDETESGGRR